MGHGNEYVLHCIAPQMTSSKTRESPSSESCPLLLLISPLSYISQGNCKGWLQCVHQAGMAIQKNRAYFSQRPLNHKVQREHLVDSQSYCQSCSGTAQMRTKSRTCTPDVLGSATMKFNINCTHQHLN